MHRVILAIYCLFLSIPSQAESVEGARTEALEVVYGICERAGDNNEICDDALISYKIDAVNFAYEKALSSAKSKADKELLVKSQEEWIDSLSSKCPFDGSFWGDDAQGVIDARERQRYCWSRSSNERCVELVGENCIE